LEALGIKNASEESLNHLKDPNKVSWESITAAAEKLIPYGTFRACSDGHFLNSGSMKYQASPQFASALLSKGVKFLVVGDLKDEWYLYSIAHPITDYASIGANLRRYYPDAIVDRILKYYGGLNADDSQEEKENLFGVMLSEGQGQSLFRWCSRLSNDTAKFTCRYAYYIEIYQVIISRF
jgi:hypothetical protein